MNRYDHNPDENPHWRPLMGRRVYRCRSCGTEAMLQTNHTGTVWAERCHGTCKDIYNPHTAREVVIWHPARPHDYVGETQMISIYREFDTKDEAEQFHNDMYTSYHPAGYSTMIRIEYIDEKNKWVAYGSRAASCD